MNRYTPNFFRRVRGFRLAVILASSAALGWTAAAWASDKTADEKVLVTVDESPIVRDDVGGLRVSFSPIVKKVGPAVVQVNVTAKVQRMSEADLPPMLRDPRLRRFFGVPENLEQAPQPRPQSGTGSGVIVSQDGYILTNNHVVENAAEILVTMSDRREFKATVVGTDPESDLAVIKVEAEGLPAVVFADSDKIEVGDMVLAVGNPFGLGQTVTSGMVSALGRATLGLDYEDFIQTDAAINPGNSGGALIDTNGRLVGINTAILSRSGGFQGIGFAIPANLARNVMQQLATDGRVVRGFLGVSIRDLTPDLALGFDLSERQAGALVSDVTADSPAERGGLKHGDIITHLNGKEILGGRQLKLAVGDVRPGQTVEATILRDGDEETLDIEIGSRPGEAMLVANNDDNTLDDDGSLDGVGVTDLDERVRREYEIPARLTGALVTAVKPGSASAEAGLQAGDVILEINRKPVRGAKDAVKLTERSTHSGRTLVRAWNPRLGFRYLVVNESEEALG
jgi:serine protease Do